MAIGTRHWYGLSDDAGTDPWQVVLQASWLAALPAAEPALAEVAATDGSAAGAAVRHDSRIVAEGSGTVSIGDASPAPGLHLTLKGVDYVGDVYGSFTTGNSLPTVKAVGANTAAIHVDFGIDATTNTVYQDSVDGGYTENAADETTAITEAKNAGLTNIMVRPLVDFLPDNYVSDPPPQTMNNPKNGSYGPDEFRAYYNPGAYDSAGANSFFASYKTMIVAQAALAAQDGASLFCIGTELDQIAGTAYLPYWTDIISTIRSADPSLKLTYSALWDDPISPWQYGGTGLSAGAGGVASQISFWNLLDYVGIDEYAPISDLADPTVNQLVQGWTQAPSDALTSGVTGGASLISYFEGIATTVGKPLIFTELGYANSSDAAINPAVPGYDQDGNPDGAVEDPTLQANLYQAFFQAWRSAGNSQLTGVYLWNWEPDASTVGTGDGTNYSVQNLAAQQTVASNYTACYAAGTRIATALGEVAVEDLRPGMLLPTASGRLRPVIWVGHRAIDCATHPRPQDVQPVRVQAHAFGWGRPHADLLLSPDHAVFVAGVLIPVRYLLNGRSVAQLGRRRVVYYHIELERHDVLLAQGLPAESYLDTGNRGSFDNAGAAVALHADFARGAVSEHAKAGHAKAGQAWAGQAWAGQAWAGHAWAERACAALVTGGPVRAAVQAGLLAQAAALGHRLTPDPRLCAWVDDEPVPVGRLGSLRHLRLPAGARQLRLVSASAVPAYLDPTSSDHRALGIGVRRLAVATVPLPMDDPRLREGWHPAERSIEGATWRWTSGDAVIDLEGLTGTDTGMELDLIDGLNYWAEPAPEPGRVAPATAASTCR